LIAAIAGFSLGALLAGSRTKTATVISPPRTFVQTVDGHLPVLIRTVRGPLQIVTVPGPTTTVSKTVPGPTKTVTRPAPSAAASGASAITDGTWQVGTDIAPGTYHARGGSRCQWEVESGSPNGSNSSILSKGALGDTNPVVTLSGGDRFTTSNCGTWH
jgi:hypothetical protein